MTARGQLRRRPHAIRQPIVRKRTSPAAVRWLGSAGIVALLFGRAVHAMQTKVGIERAAAAFLEEAPIARFRKYSVRVSREFPCHSSRYWPFLTQWAPFDFLRARFAKNASRQKDMSCSMVQPGLGQPRSRDPDVRA